MVVGVERLVAGGVGLSRREDGRVVLVDGGRPGERLEVSVIERKGSEHGRIVRVLEASPGRIEPVCPYVIEGCGGCDLAHLAHEAQLDAKIGIVADALRRLGKWKEPVVAAGPVLDPWAFVQPCGRQWSTVVRDSEWLRVTMYLIFHLVR